MSEARRRLRSWILTALLERGCDPAAVLARHHWQAARIERPLTRGERRQLLADPYAGVRFFPSRRRHR